MPAALNVIEASTLYNGVILATSSRILFSRRKYKLTREPQRIKLYHSESAPKCRGGEISSNIKQAAIAPRHAWRRQKPISKRSKEFVKRISRAGAILGGAHQAACLAARKRASCAILPRTRAIAEVI